MCGSPIRVSTSHPNVPLREKCDFRCGALVSDASDVLGALASGLAVDAAESGKKALEVLRARSPELFELSEQTGEDLVATSASFIDVLLATLRVEDELPWKEYDQRARAHGRLRAAQGVPLESAIEVLAVYRRATLELLTQPLEGKPRSDEVLALAQSRLESVIERLTSTIARGYLDYLDEEHRIRENELYGLAAIAAVMGRSLDINDTAEVALAETLAAFGLDGARQFSNEARTDHLTGLANRREFERAIEREVALAERHDRQVTVMMIDVDNLKKINDRHGHSAGDAALKLVGQELQRVMRASDVCGRIGGDEFAVAMPETDSHQAGEVARRLRDSIQAMNLGARSTNTVEVSVGLGAWRPGMDWEAMVQVADLALYEDKRHRKEVRRWSSAEGKSPTIRFGGGTGRRRVVGG